MSEPLGRRALLQSAAAAGLAFAAGSHPASAQQNLPKLSYGDLTTGVTGIISANITANRFDLKHGVDMTNLIAYAAVSAYYNDFAAGTFDVALGSWDFFADMFQKGVPIKMVCSVTTADMIQIIAAPPIKSLGDLAGKTMSAVVGSGSYAMSRVVAKDVAKIDFTKDVQVQNAPSPAGCITLLQSGNTVSALSWEPAISNAIAAQPALRSIFDLGTAYRSVNKGVLPYFSVAVRNDTLKKFPGIADRIAGVFQDTIAYINHVPTIAFNNAAPKTGLATSVMMTGFNTDRLKFATYAMNVPAGQKLVMTAYEYLRAHGVYDKPLSPDFFA